MNRTILFFLLILMSSSCGSAIKDNIYGNYFLVASDIGEDLSLTYHDPTDGSNYGTIVGATVFAAGHTDKYIVVKQHPRAFPNQPDKTITNYFILPMKKGFNWKDKNGLIGPLTLEQYGQNSKQLQLGKIVFHIVYRDLQ